MEHRSSTVVLHWFLSWACQLGSIAGLFAAVKTSTGICTTQPVLGARVKKKGKEKINGSGPKRFRCLRETGSREILLRS